MRSSSRSVARSSAASGIGPVRVLNLRDLRRSGFQRTGGADGRAYRNAADNKGRYAGSGRALAFFAVDTWRSPDPWFLLSRRVSSEMNQRVQDAYQTAQVPENREHI